MDFINVDNIEFVFLTFIRTFTIIVFLPVFGYQGVDMRVKVLLSILLTILIFPYVTYPEAILGSNISAYFGYAVSEIVVGIIIGFMPVFLFAAFQFAGELMGLQMGLSMMAMMDPTSEMNLSVMSRLKYIFVMLIFLISGGHLFFIKAIVESFTVIEIGHINLTSFGAIMNIVTDNLMNLFIIGIKAGAPVVISLFVIESALGIMARTVPQMNIFLVGFPLKILIGFVMFITGLGLIVQIFLNHFGLLESDIFKIIDILGS
ncbi:MAG: flagellar biosynthetic protein FliR [Candidatus Delongbacteria bacterium]|nr:flagellar biosynthetic protein FliR [Candidatus Delongbacteria bacterium]MBN2835681.1 flagellar biosynthetic protein FliR [Candidatus Delongbacteria bacterium]